MKRHLNIYFRCFFTFSVITLPYLSYLYRLILTCKELLIFAIVLGRPELVFATVSELVLTAIVLILSIIYRHKTHIVKLCDVDVDVSNQEGTS